jgi:hypothetical protein
MLRFLRDTVADHKLRLFACAIARLALRGQASSEAIAVAEDYAGRRLSPARLRAFHVTFPRKLVAEFLVRADAASGAMGVARYCFDVKTSAPLLRCIVGNPFRPFTAVPTWLSWNDGAVKLASVLDQERELPSGALDVVRLAILADALEEAGGGPNPRSTIFADPAPRSRMSCGGCRPGAVLKVPRTHGYRPTLSLRASSRSGNFILAGTTRQRRDGRHARSRRPASFSPIPVRTVLDLSVTRPGKGDP